MIKQALNKNWLEALSIYKNHKVLSMLFLGFSAGLPLLLILGTLSFWLSEAKIDRSTIGHLSWIGLAYGFKWLWSPLVDKLKIPYLTQKLGRRRSWLLIAQIVLLVSIFGMSQNDPALNLSTTVYLAIITAFASATQDIALDAYRIEAVDTSMQGAMAATYQAGYRIGMIVAGAGALWIASGADASEGTYEFYPWKVSYMAMSLFMLIGIIATLIISESQNGSTDAQDSSAGENLNAIQKASKWLSAALLSPLLDFAKRYKWQAVVILSFIAIYRISDVVMGVMSNPFYNEMGFTKDEVATVSKVYGVIMTIAGAAIGGVFVSKLGVTRVLFLGALLSSLTNLLFVWITQVGHNVSALVLTVSADNLSSGIASSAFIAYLSGLTNRAYSATQYALLTSMMLLFPKFIAGFSGDFVNHYGWSSFFTGTALIGIPVLFLIKYIDTPEKAK